MHSFPRSWLSLGILAVLGGQRFAHPYSPKANSQQPLVIHVYNLAGVPLEILNHAFQDSSRILDTAGIDTFWQRGQVGAPESRIVDLSVPNAAKCPGNLARSYIVMLLVRGVPEKCFPGALGYALPCSPMGVNATIFFDRVERLAEPGAIDLATVLGRTMAHEIGHLLLGSTGHTRKGIMKAVWDTDDFRIRTLGALEFTPSQRAAIQKAYPSKNWGTNK